MDKKQRIREQLKQTDFSDPESIERYAENLEGMTFREVLDLEIVPEGTEDKSYNSRRYKGGMGNLIEERFFGYRANSDAHADFDQAGIELKATCYDLRDEGKRKSAGERLVLTMIPHSEPIDVEFDSSHLWEKSSKILLVYYERDKQKDSYDQRIDSVCLFMPPEEDLKIIRDDYRKIVELVRAGRADELSEGLTDYLAACTKGANRAKSTLPQYYPQIDPVTGEKIYKKARTRAFSFKRSYMDYVLNHYVLNKKRNDESIIKGDIGEQTFEQYVQGLINAHVGTSDREFCERFGLTYKADNKSLWRAIVYRLLGMGDSENAAEFKKAGISVRTIRYESNGRLKESVDLPTFEFNELAAEDDWDGSQLKDELESTRYFFIVFKKEADRCVLLGCRFWSMPEPDIETLAHQCWEQARDTVRRGVKLIPKTDRSGKVTISNDLPSTKDNIAMHVRPHASLSAYLLEDGRRFGSGSIERNASELPDGRWMTKQCFWFNASYIKAQLDIEFDSTKP